MKITPDVMFQYVQLHVKLESKLVQCASEEKGAGPGNAGST